MMIWQYRHTIQALLIGAIILFPWCGIMGMADAESGKTQEPGATSMSKRQGQSPANKPTSKSTSGDTRKSGPTSVGKRQGQSPANKPTSNVAPKDTGEKSIPLDDRRQGQSPGNE